MLLHEGCMNIFFRKQWVKRIFFIIFMFTIPTRRYTLERKESFQQTKSRMKWFVHWRASHEKNFFPSLYSFLFNICFTENKFLTNFITKNFFIFLIISRVGWENKFLPLFICDVIKNQLWKWHVCELYPLICCLLRCCEELCYQEICPIKSLHLGNWRLYWMSFQLIEILRTFIFLFDGTAKLDKFWF